MTNKNWYVEAILPRPLDGTFTYLLPESLVEKAKPGMRVIIGFGKKKIYTAIIYSVHNRKPDSFDVKPVIDILDDNTVVNERQLKLWDWISDYYMCSLGEVYNAALPSGLKLESESRILYNSDFNSDFAFSKRESSLLDVLEKQGVMNLGEVSDVLQIKQPFTVLQSLIDKEVILVEEKLQQSYKVKTINYIKLSDDYRNEDVLNNIIEELSKAKKQQQVLLSYIDLSCLFSKNNEVEVKRDLLQKKSSSTYSVIKALIGKGILEEYKKETDRLPDNIIAETEKKTLNDSQQEAYQKINSIFLKKNVVLLHGITSSGKTEIYIHLISEVIKSGRQVLYLLPEIALTTQIITRLSSVFGSDIGVYHSRISDSERIEVWNRVKNTDKKNSYKIILGARSSVFLPFNDLGLIVVDEEHENSYKQQSPAPRYNARDVAVVLGHIHKAKVLLGSATPAIESYYNSASGKYGLVELNKRYLDMQLPEVVVADVLRSRKRKMMKSIFTPELVESIKASLELGEQVILFQNRRGFSPYTECLSCGWIHKCDNCDVSMIYHKRTNNMNCHYCGHTQNSISKCPECGDEKLEMRGYGTEKVEQEVLNIFPEAKVSRLDYDSTRKKKSYEILISDFESGKIDILVGTQMVSKGLDFDNVSVVGVLNADSMMNFPDFRAHERSYQLMAQVSGRAGRKKKRGKVIVQTNDPEHPIIKYVTTNDYGLMFNDQLIERNDYNYPPYYRIIKIVLKHKVKYILDNAAEELGQKLREIFGDRMLGPESPAVNRIQLRYIKNILLKIEKNKSSEKARELIKRSCAEVISDPEFKNLSVIFDVDPV